MKPKRSAPGTLIIALALGCLACASCQTESSVPAQEATPETKPQEEHKEDTGEKAIPAQSSMIDECKSNDDCKHRIDRGFYLEGWFLNEPNVYCNQELRRCVECAADRDCGDGNLCVIDEWRCAKDDGICATFDDCPGNDITRYACVNGSCERCTSNEDCDEGAFCADRDMAKQLGYSRAEGQCVLIHMVEPVCLEDSCPNPCTPLCAEEEPGQGYSCKIRCPRHEDTNEEDD